MDKTTSVVLRIKDFYKKATATPSNHEEEEANFLLACRMLRICYFLHTADHHLNKNVSKTLQFVLFTLLLILLLSGQVYYTVILLNGSIVFDIEECLLVLLPVGVHFSVFGFRPIYIFFFDDAMTSMFSYISTFKTKFNAIGFEFKRKISFTKMNDDDLHDPNWNVFRKENIITGPITFLILSVCTVYPFALFPQLYYILRGGDHTPNSVDYFTLFPFYDRIQSRALYYVLTTVASLIGILEMTIVFFHITYLYTLSCIMRYNALDISEKIHMFSQYYLQECEKSSLVADEEDGRDQIIDSKNDRFSLIEKDLIRLIKEHQKFTIAVKTLHSFTNIFLAAGVIFGSTVMFGVTAILMLVALGMIQKLRFIFGALFMMVGMFSCCAMAAVHEDMSEMYRYAVYDLPWYRLPPKTRKIVNIFQCTVISHQEFKILGVYPINMAFFPRLWSSVYSYANILRTMTKH